MEIQIESIGVIVTIVIGVGVGTLIGFLLHSERRRTRLESQVGNIEKVLDDFKPLKEALSGFMFVLKNPALIKALIVLAKEVNPPEEKRNPYDPDEKDRLLNKYQEGSINVDEAERLQEILNEDLEMTEEKGVSAIAIGLLLIGLGALIAYLLKRK